MICPACKKDVSIEANFCSSCGTKMSPIISKQQYSISDFEGNFHIFNLDKTMRCITDTDIDLFTKSKEFYGEAPFHYILSHSYKNSDWVQEFIKIASNKNSCASIADHQSELIKSLKFLILSAVHDDSIRHNILEIIKSIIKNFTQINNNLINECFLYSITSTGLDAFWDYFLSIGANIEYSLDGYFPLYNASANGNIRAVKLLLARGANVNRRWPEKGYTSLMTASLNGQMAVVNLLLENGADVNIEAHCVLPPKTAYEMARANGHKAIARLIKDNGASTNIFRNIFSDL
jgi:hypothetical protein